MKRPKRIGSLIITHKTKLGDIFERNTKETKRIIKQMEVYGLHTIGYGIDYSNTIEQHAVEQAIPEQHLKNLLRSINKKILE